MLKKALLAIFGIALLAGVNAQEKEEFKPHGKMEVRIYSNFNADVVGDGDDKAFQLKRSYFGYKYNITPEFRAHVRVDLAGNEYLSGDENDGKEMQYVFFKTAALYYEKTNWFAAFGLQDTYQFKEQESLWGKRYILPSLLDRQKFISSADIGASAKYHTDQFVVDVAVFNGEGYKNLQQDNDFRASLGVTGFFADKKIIARAYVDQSTDEVQLGSVTGFIGLDLDKFTLGAEYTTQKNYRYKEGHDRNAYSFFTQYNFTHRIGLWARLDGMSSDFSNVDQEYIDNQLKVDGEDIFAGVEFKVVPKKINTSLNYQHHISDEADPVNSGKIFINLEVRF